MQINEGTKINTEVNKRPLKNIDTHWIIRHRWFQRVSISFYLSTHLPMVNKLNRKGYPYRKYSPVKPLSKYEAYHYRLVRRPLFMSDYWTNVSFRDWRPETTQVDSRNLTHHKNPENWSVSVVIHTSQDPTASEAQNPSAADTSSS